MIHPYDILAISSWYPSVQKPGFGIFVKRHLLDIAQKRSVKLLYFDFEACPVGRNSRYSMESTGKLEEHVVQVGGFGGKVASFIRVWYWYFKLVVCGPLKKHRIMHLHIPYHIGLILSPFLLRSSRPLVISEHWSGYFREDGRYAKLSFISRWIIGKLFGKSKMVTAVSRPLLDSIAFYYLVEHKSMVIPNTVRRDIHVRELASVVPGYFLMVANLNDTEKNITGAIRAFHQLWKKFHDVKLVIVGSGPDFKLIQDFRDSLGLSDSVCQLKGYVDADSLDAFYAQAICYIMNSNFETFSISTMEALLYGVPVISTRCKGPESFINPANGYLIDVGQSAQLLQAMEYMLSHYAEFNPAEVRASIPNELQVDISDTFTDVFELAIRKDIQ